MIGGEGAAGGESAGEVGRVPSLRELATENVAAYLGAYAREDEAWATRGAEVLASFAREESMASVATAVLRKMSLLGRATRFHLQGVAQGCLRRLELPDVGVVEGWPWTEALSSCPLLQELNLEAGRGLCGAECELPRGLLRCASLEVLRLAHSDADDDVIAAAIAGSGRTLRALDVTWCSLVTDAPFAPPLPASAETGGRPVLGGLALCRSLAELRIGATTCSARTVEAALTHCAHLHTLSLAMAAHVATLPRSSGAGEGISTATLRGLRSLRDIDVSGLHSVPGSHADLFLTST